MLGVFGCQRHTRVPSPSSRVVLVNDAEADRTAMIAHGVSMFVLAFGSLCFVVFVILCCILKLLVHCTARSCCRDVVPFCFLDVPCAYTQGVLNLGGQRLEDDVVHFIWSSVTMFSINGPRLCIGHVLLRVCQPHRDRCFATTQ